MQLSEIEQALKAHFETAKTDAETFLAQHLPGIEEVAAKIESDPLVQFAMRTVLSGTWRTLGVDFLGKLEGLQAEAEQAKAQAAAEAAAQATAAAQAPPEAPEPPAEVPADETETAPVV